MNEEIRWKQQSGTSGQLSMTERQRSITDQVRSEEHSRHAMNDDDNEQTEHHRLVSTTGQGKMDEQKYVTN